MQFDGSGLIVTLDGDGGDTCAEEGRYWFLLWFNNVHMKNSIWKLLPNRITPPCFYIESLIASSPSFRHCDGEYLRNPNTYNNPYTTSRDQLLPIIYYCAAYKDYNRLRELFFATTKRGFFAQNDQNYDGSKKIPDQMFTCIGDFIRCGGWWTAIFYPLLYFFDTITLLGNVLWLVMPYNIPAGALWNKPSTWFTPRSPSDVDDNNTDVGIFAAVAFKPTLISELNRLIWGQFRPRNTGNLMALSDNNCLAAIAWYHDPINKGNIEIVTLYKAPVLKYLKKL